MSATMNSRSAAGSAGRTTDIAALRRDFPALGLEINGKPFAVGVSGVTATIRVYETMVPRVVV